jgi:hypothetical protein
MTVTLLNDGLAMIMGGSRKLKRLRSKVGRALQKSSKLTYFGVATLLEERGSSALTKSRGKCFDLTATYG